MPWASAVLLWLYLLGLGWFAPLVTAGMAAMDESHGVGMVAGMSGSRVVLTHDPSNPDQVPWHRHCAMAMALAALAADDATRQDHVLSFPTGIDVVRSSSLEPSFVPLPSLPPTEVGDVVLWLLERAPIVSVIPADPHLDTTACAVARVMVIRC